MQNYIVQKSESLSRKCLTGRDNVTIDRLMDKMKKKNTKSLGANCVSVLVFERATHSDREDEEPTLGVCIMWAKLNGSPGGFMAGRSRDINQT